MVTEVENVKSSPAPEPVTDIADEDHVENINIIFIGHVGKYKFFFFLLSSFPLLSVRNKPSNSQK